MVNKARSRKPASTLPTRDWSYDDYKAHGEAFKGKLPNGMRLRRRQPGLREPPLENWLRQRGKALYTADGKLGFDADDLTEWFKLGTSCARPMAASARRRSRRSMPPRQDRHHR